MKYLPILFLSILLSQDRSAVVSGICYLEGESDHAGTEVLFAAVSGSAVTQTVYTDGEGAFTAGLSEGIRTTNI